MYVCKVWLIHSLLFRFMEQVFFAKLSCTVCCICHMLQFLGRNLSEKTLNVMFSPLHFIYPAHGERKDHNILGDLTLAVFFIYHTADSQIPTQNMPQLYFKYSFLTLSSLFLFDIFIGAFMANLSTC